MATKTWSWSGPGPGRDELGGPFPVRVDDVRELNNVFSDAFTERYRRDGMVGVRVPFLNPAVWRYAIEDAAGGAMLWRDERGELAAFNIAHRSGGEGWMGPLAVRSDRQGRGEGSRIVSAGVQWLVRGGTTTVGLETMPRTMDNIGFYSALGFLPGRLTITITIDAAAGAHAPALLGRLSNREKEDAIAETTRLTGELLAGCDFAREIALTDELSLGDTVLVWRGDALAGFALCHTIPLVEGRAREELRVLKLAVDTEADFDTLIMALTDFARRSGTRRVAFRVQGEYPWMHQRLIALGGRVRWTDLRMVLNGYPERRPERGAVLSNWEI
ncbi:MAG: hypothetical protein NVS4B3_21060 [Gemmatimonadaceae bacterium]